MDVSIYFYNIVLCLFTLYMWCHNLSHIQLAFLLTIILLVSYLYDNTDSSINFNCYVEFNNYAKMNLFILLLINI